MAARRSTHDLREACVAEARAIIAETGVEGLSLREVARRLGVSHQAPYKHYPSRDHLLAEVVARAYADFAAYLDARPHHDEPHADLRGMGEAYVRYALSHPLEYRLMFGTPLPDPAAHPDMLRQSRHAFAILRDAIARLDRSRSGDPPPELDAMYVWATVHGLASAMQGSVVGTLGLGEDMLAAMPAHVLSRIGTGLGQAEAGGGSASPKHETGTGARRRQSSVRR
jgi:AcrR family transcriptional regulator